MISALGQRPGVQYAEKNWLLTNTATSDDPYYTGGNLWGMYGDASSPKNSFGSQAAEAWAAGYTGSGSVYVGIIDEGYQVAHPDLSANAGTNPGEIAGNNIDDDKNGYVDDVYGWDFVGRNNSVYDGTGDDHGTHVAGTIGATGGNSAGVAGVNWDVKLLSGKFLGANGGSTADAILAVDYFTNLKNNGLNIIATNNSWGGGGYSQSLHDAIIRHADAGILFIAAAGNSNSNNDSTGSYPSNYNTTIGTSTKAAASYDGVIAVASIDSAGSKSSFSSYGKTTVDLGAPGSNVMSTLPSNTYGALSGTSMATPHVTGAAALLKSIYSWATAAQIRQALLQAAALTPSLNGITVTNGRLDIPAAIARLGELGGGGTSLPQISLSVPDGNASETGPDPGSFSLSRTGGEPSASLTVNLLWTGTATNGSDYTNPLTATFAGGESTITVTVTPLDDTVFEGNETVTLSLTTGSGYTLGATTTASITIADNDPAPPSSDYWGSQGSDTGTSSVVGDPIDNIIGGVTKLGTDTGRGTTDTLTGRGGTDTFVLADRTRGIYYNDGNSKNNGYGDYALITDLKTSENDRVQLLSGRQYLYRNSGSDTQLFLGDGNKTFSASDEYIALIQGVNLAPAGTTGFYIMNMTTPPTWVTFV